LTDRDADHRALSRKIPRKNFEWPG